MKEEKLTVEKAIEITIPVVDKLVEHHLTLEERPLTMKERVEILYETCPELGVDESKLMMSVAIAMLVAEREKKK